MALGLLCQRTVLPAAEKSETGVIPALEVAEKVGIRP